MNQKIILPLHQKCDIIYYARWKLCIPLLQTAYFFQPNIENLGIKNSLETPCYLFLDNVVATEIKTCKTTGNVV